MVLRFCHRCGSDVEDAGGFCLLGHPLRLEPLIPSVAEIRDEVREALQDVELPEAGDEPAPSAVGAGRVGADAVASPPGLDNPPSLPPRSIAPSPPAAGHAHHTVWQSLDESPSPDSVELPGDPIAAFAPPPRMDWGPERTGVRELRPLRRKHRPASA